uniref:restriction endonuclease subunit S n=1 Tax=Alloprevotella sp. TaxID=1872471 RepID=UPI00402892AA
MERYHEYKDSGEKWLGEIPSHWEVKRIKYIFREVDKRNTQLKYRLLSFSKNKGIVPFSSLKDKRQSSEGLEDYKVIHKGQLLENRMQAWHGMFAKSAIDGCVSPDYSVFQKINPLDDVEYFAKLFRDPLMIQQFAIASKGMGDGFNRLYTPQFGSIYTIYPPFQEQTAMVAYLDRVTAQIDKAIAQQQRMIDLLNERKQIIIQHAVTKGLDPNAEMVDSGVEWIGEMPKGWKIIPMKYVISFINGYAFDSNIFKKDGEVPVIRIGNLTQDGINYDDIVYVNSNTKLDKVRTVKGDLLIAMSGATTGKVCIDNIGGLYVNQRVGVIRSKYINFIRYWLQSDNFKVYIYINAIGSAQPNISSDQICNFKIAFPINQKDIDSMCVKLSYIDRHISSIIAKYNKRISLLRERKQIIINEVITGKVKVS